MSKKKKNKKGQKNVATFFKGYDERFTSVRKNTDKEEKKKKNKKKEDKFDLPKFRNVKRTLDKKLEHRAEEAAFQPPTVPREITKARKICNHAVRKMSVKEFTDAGYNTLIVPQLQTYIDTFGEENVSICAGCFTPLVSDSAMQKAKNETSYIGVISSIDFVLSHYRMDEDEVEEMIKLRTKIEELQWTISQMISKIQESEKKEMAVRSKSGYGGDYTGGAPVVSSMSNGLTIPTNASI